MKSKEPLTAFLLKNRWLEPEKLTEAIRQSAEQKESLCQTLIRLEFMDAKKINALFSQYYGVPFIQGMQSIEASLFHLLPEPVIRKYKTVPIKLNEKTLTVAMVEPDDQFSKEYVQMVSGYLIEVMGILESDFNKTIDLYFASSKINAIVKDLSIPEVESLVKEVVTGDEDKPIAKIVDTVLVHAVKLAASDVHIEPQEKEFLIRFRIDGLLRTIEILPSKLYGHVASRIKIMAGMNIAERRLPQDGQMRFEILQRDIDIRVSSLPSRYGENIVLRILDKTSFLFGLERLGLNSRQQTKIEEIVSQNAGMFLVTGPTGSGKTTTLYACINQIRSPSKKIITLEDPIEYELLAGKSQEGGITQVQINPKIGLTFVECLKATLRQDPDILFVGELRDKESVEIAFTAALTGHFVLSSLHTIGAAVTITRLLDMGVEPFLIVSTLKGVLAQRLVRMLCTHCKEPYNPPAKIVEKLALKSVPKQEPILFYRPKGCPWCAKTGYRGRIGIYELMEVNDHLRNLILNKAPNSEIFKCTIENGMETLRKSGLDAVIEGVTTVAEVLRVAPHQTKIGSN